MNLPSNLVSEIWAYVNQIFSGFGALIVLLVAIPLAFWILNVIFGLIGQAMETRAAVAPKPVIVKILGIEEQIGRKLTRKERKLFIKAQALQTSFKEVMKGGSGISTYSK
jgi:hypothetical protein